jgi:hypothetical protein
MSNCKRMVVEIDGMVGSFNCYELNPKGWNGWAVPGFELSVALEVCKQLEHPLGRFEHNKEWDFLGWQEPGNKEIWEGVEYCTEDGVKTLYAIGNGWCWSHIMYGHQPEATDELTVWLKNIQNGIVGCGVDHMMREFITGMHKRGLAYHWDDCALDCLDGQVTKETATLINGIVGQLYCEEMFVLSNQLIDEEENKDPQLKAMEGLLMMVSDPKDKKEVEDAIAKRIADLSAGTPGIGKSYSSKDMHQFDKRCICDIRDLCTQGCKCGGK